MVVSDTEEESWASSLLFAEKNAFSMSSSVEVVSGELFGRSSGVACRKEGTKSGVSSLPDVKKNGRYTGSCLGGMYA